jgi:hypothetical protein
VIGGFYVVAVQPFEEVERVGLVAGPFATWADADKAGPGAVAHVNQMPKQTGGPLSFGIGEFYYHKLITGSLNAPLWVKASPIERQ